MSDADGGKSIRTLVVDDDPLMRVAMRLLLERVRRVVVIGTAGDGYQGLLLANSLQPDLVLADLHMPEMNGMEFTSQLGKQSPHTRVIIVTADDRPEVHGKCLAAGALGVVTKDRMCRDLLREIERVFTPEQRIPAAAVGCTVAR